MITPARAPRGDPAAGRYVRVDARAHAVVLRRGTALAGEFRRGDLLVVNDAATMPASLAARTESGEDLELRLAGPGDGGGWWAIAFGQGSWRMRTEDRPPPPPLAPGTRLVFEGGLGARVTAVAPDTPRLVAVTFDRQDEALWAALYRAGRPVQYSHLAGEVELWDVQTRFAGRPWAVEPPSAGFALDMALLLELGRRGVAVARVTHAAGLSSTGDATLDRRLPLSERFEVPAATVAAVARAHRRGGRVIAIGTTVARALEGNAALHGGRLRAACGMTDHRLGPGVPRHVVDGLWSGLHAPGTSHFALAESFAARPLLERALAAAEAAGYVGEEFGDGMLLLDYAPGPKPARGVRTRRAAAASSSSHNRRPGAGLTRAAGGRSSSLADGGGSSTAATASALAAPLTTKITRRAADSTGRVSVSRRGDSAGPPSTATTARSRTASAGECGNSDAVWPSLPRPSHTRSSTGTPPPPSPTVPRSSPS